MQSKKIGKLRIISLEEIISNNNLYQAIKNSLKEGETDIFLFKEEKKLNKDLDKEEFKITNLVKASKLNSKELICLEIIDSKIEETRYTRSKFSDYKMILINSVGGPLTQYYFLTDDSTKNMHDIINEVTMDIIDRPNSYVVHYIDNGPVGIDVVEIEFDDDFEEYDDKEQNFNSEVTTDSNTNNIPNNTSFNMEYDNGEYKMEFFDLKNGEFEEMMEMLRNKNIPNKEKDNIDKEKSKDETKDKIASANKLIDKLLKYKGGDLYIGSELQKIKDILNGRV